MVQTAPVSSEQFPADSTAADDILQRWSFDCLRDGFSMGQNKTQNKLEMQSFALLLLIGGEEFEYNAKKYLQ